MVNDICTCKQSYWKLPISGHFKRPRDWMTSKANLERLWLEEPAPRGCKRTIEGSLVERCWGSMRASIIVVKGSWSGSEGSFEFGTLRQWRTYHRPHIAGAKKPCSCAAGVDHTWHCPLLTFPPSPEGCHNAWDLEAWYDGCLRCLRGPSWRCKFQNIPEHSRTSACQYCLCNEIRILWKWLAYFLLSYSVCCPAQRIRSIMEPCQSICLTFGFLVQDTLLPLPIQPFMVLQCFCLLNCC